LTAGSTFGAGKPAKVFDDNYAESFPESEQAARARRHDDLDKTDFVAGCAQP
jgi:hypothetical protein